MSLVNTETGEIVEPPSRDHAERWAERARLDLEAAADRGESGLTKIRTGIAERHDLSLHYRSIGEYVSTEFADALGNVCRVFGVEFRRQVVQELSQAGLSTRAIAPVVGVTDRHVRRDVEAIRGGTYVPPAPIPTPQSEGDSASGADDPAQTEATSGVNRPQDYPEAPAPAPRPAITGIDGKSYSRPTPKPRPVLDDNAAEYDNAEKASLALSRAVRKLLEFQHPNMRDGMRRYWSMASVEVPPVQRADVTPEQMRVAAHGLLALADEWERP